MLFLLKMVKGNNNFKLFFVQIVVKVNRQTLAQMLYYGCVQLLWQLMAKMVVYAEVYGLRLRSNDDYHDMTNDDVWECSINKDYYHSLLTHQQSRVIPTLPMTYTTMLSLLNFWLKAKNQMTATTFCQTRRRYKCQTQKKTQAFLQKI